MKRAELIVGRTYVLKRGPYEVEAVLVRCDERKAMVSFTDLGYDPMTDEFSPVVRYIQVGYTSFVREVEYRLPVEVNDGTAEE